MRDLMYNLRHPIQEARIALHEIRRQRKLPWNRGTWGRRRTLWRFGQWIARLLSAPAWNDANYCDEIRRDLIGEDDGGYIMAASSARADWWEPFNVRNPRHIAAAIRSGRIRQVNFLDLERI